MINKELIITRNKAIDIADDFGLGDEVIYEMDHNGCSPYEALQEWDLLPALQDKKPNVAEILKIFHEQ